MTSQCQQRVLRRRKTRDINARLLLRVDPGTSLVAHSRERLPCLFYASHVGWIHRLADASPPDALLQWVTLEKGIKVHLTIPGGEMYSRRVQLPRLAA
jgi:hypothetical protein